MSNIVPESSLELKKQEPLTVREKIVNIFQELEEETKDEQHRINIELDKEIQARIQAESEANRLRRQVQTTEINLDNTTAKVEHLTTQLIEFVKVSETARHICTDMDNKLNTVKDKEIDLDEALIKAKESSLEKDKHFQEIANKSTELQELIEHSEQRSTIAEQRNALLEKDIRSAYVEMKSLMQIEEKAHVKETNYKKTIEELQAQLKSAQQRTDEAEGDVGKLQYKADKLKEKLIDERKKCSQIQKMINSTS